MTDQHLEPTRTDGPLNHETHWAIMLKTPEGEPDQLIDTAWSEQQARELVTQYNEQGMPRNEFYAEQRDDLRHPAWH